MYENQTNSDGDKGPGAEAVARVVDAANQHPDEGPTEELITAINELVAQDKHLDANTYRALSESIKQIRSPMSAGFVAVWLGATVENGADPHVPLPHVLEYLYNLIATIQTPKDDEPDDAVPEPGELVQQALDHLGQALVAMLIRCPDAIRELIRREQAVSELERVEHLASGPKWILALLRQRSGELLVLHGVEGVGVRVKYENIENCFHLFTLLQGLLQRVMPGAKTQSTTMYKIARGELVGQVHDSAWWHYGRAGVPKADFVGMVFGEPTLDSIDEVDGQQVLLLWPPIIADRSWNSGFFQPIIDARKPNVELLEKLSPDEVKRWRERLGLPAAKARPWWRFWS